MEAVVMTPMTTTRTVAPLAAIREKLQFLRGSFSLLIAWPIAALILCLAGWAALFAHLDGEKKQAENNALKVAGALSRSYTAQLTRTLESLDQTLLHVRHEWALSNGLLRLENIKEMGFFPPTSLLDVAIIDRNGKSVTRTIPDTKEVSVADTAFFLVHKYAITDSLYIGVPMYSPISNRSVIPFSRRLADDNGNFDGIVLVAAVPSYLTANYDEITLGKYGLLGVVGTDRVIRVMRTGQTEHPPESPAVVSIPEFGSKTGSGLLDGKKWFADKRSRYVGWDTGLDYSLIALTGLDEQEALLPYWANHASSIRGAIWSTAALALFTLIAMVLSMRLAWRKYKMELTQTTYRMATEEGKEGFYIARPIYDAHGAAVDFEIVDSNHRGAEFLRERREELIGKKISALYEGANPERLMGWLRQAIDKGFYEADVDVPGDGPLTVRYAHLKIVRSDDELAITLRDIGETRAHVAELERRGNEDALTGLPNRHWAQTYLPRAIEHAAASNAMLALLFVDLDGFKRVNDTKGHAAGDELLRNAARRLKDAVRPHDNVVRLGGDEFLVIIEQIAHKTDAAQVAERVVDAFRESFRLSQGVHSIGTSIGISTFPSDGADSDTLLHNADIAMYSVKTSGKGNYHFYDQKFYETLRARLEKESELRHAIEHDQFIMYYQPRVDISTGTTSSMEALVRWVHPSKGLMEPLEFIPLAEETGLILGLGELVIDKVCAQLAWWAKSGQELVPVSVNVSSRQFNEADTAKILSAALGRHNIDPKLIEIELTESSMMGCSLDTANALTAIRRMGITLLVDDFGAGYSSLSQLQRLDFDMLKVDRAFTDEIDRTEQGKVFFKAIITMAHALGMRVVAEGVENETQIKVLKSLFCDEIQGFYISRPLPPSETQPILPKWFFPSTT
jgi:diguanylate cyclase (GGDEF)-like protein